jgi:hypothetical protein
MPTRIVYLAAGKSQRFADIGFRLPKCGLPVNYGTATSPDIKSILTTNVLGCASDHDILIRHPDVAVPAGLEDVVVTKTQRGPAASAMLASAHVLPNDSVIFIETDNYFKEYQFVQQIKALLKDVPNSFGSVITRAPDAWSDINVEGLAAMSNSVFKFRLSNKDVLGAVSSSLAERYSKPFGPESGDPLTGVAADPLSVNVGVYFVQQWRHFMAAYNTEVDRRDNGTPGSDSVSEISILDVLRTLEMQSVPNMHYIAIPFAGWRPCGTVDQYLMNRGW